jgi:hypothetical protein
VDPQDYATTSVDEDTGPAGLERTTTVSGGPSFTNWQLRLEMKL